MSILHVPLIFSSREAVPRRGEPVTLGLPWPRGAVRQASQFQLDTPQGRAAPLQCRVLDHWPEGSIRWCLFDLAADWDGRTAASGYVITAREGGTGIAESIPPINLPSITLAVIVNNNIYEIIINQYLTIEFTGFYRHHYTIREARLAGLLICGTCDVFPSANCLRLALTIRNPRAARHPGGNWDLGDAGSILIQSATLTVTQSPAADRVSIQYSLERNAPWNHAEELFLEQYSSGGERWNSINHIDRFRQVPLKQRGYFWRANDAAGVAGSADAADVASAASAEGNGLRANPVVLVQTRDSLLGFASEHFWEVFPKSIHASRSGLKIGIFPPGLHELQGGEQTTFRGTIAFGRDGVTEPCLVWARSPIVAVAPPEWYAASGAVRHLIPKAADPHQEYLALCDQAIIGTDTFERKREAIDEYGWRHFGDIWGDHEAVDHPGRDPMVSHYNNQYDCIAGLLYQFLRSGDVRWMRLGIECAYHTVDIDIYHTEEDKSAYNGGLFWHTYHYAPADTGTHRSYPKSLRQARHFAGGKDLQSLGATGAALQRHYAVGGGPAAAHNYNHGLMLAWLLTGDPALRAAAIGLARFVIDMDDGRKTIFRWLSRRDTGLAIQSSAGYLGPGRASGNSLAALITGHRLTGERQFLVKAAQIVQRVVHPRQELHALDLLNAELRWFYVMFLQALGDWLDYKAELGELDADYAYGRESLLHYARWMAEHERPILSEPEKLQYPTETWAAQDLRKVEVFQFAAKHAVGAERARFLERAQWFFEESVRRLSTFPPTPRGIARKSLCRPVILCLNFGWSRAWWLAHPAAEAPAPWQPLDLAALPPWRMYEPQKAVAIRRGKRLFLAGSVLMLALALWLIARQIS